MGEKEGAGNRARWRRIENMAILVGPVGHSVDPIGDLVFGLVSLLYRRHRNDRFDELGHGRGRGDLCHQLIRQFDPLVH